jgi:hypothetical protein
MINMFYSVRGSRIYNRHNVFSYILHFEQVSVTTNLIVRLMHSIIQT